MGNTVDTTQSSGQVLAVYNASGNPSIPTPQPISQPPTVGFSGPGQGPRTITLTLKQVQASASTAVRPSGPATAGNPTQQQPTTSQTVTVAQVTFDIQPGIASGFAQTTKTTFEARQTIHQTMGGYYVDEFSMAPGAITISAIAIYQGDAIAKLQAFKDLLQLAKSRQDPLSMLAPCALEYFNNINGQSYILTQSSVDIQEFADRPNQALITIIGSILVDTTNRTQTLNVQQFINQQANTQSALMSYTDLSQTINLAQPDPGVTALS